MSECGDQACGSWQAPNGNGEWVGGRFRLPVYIWGEGVTYRPDAIVWLEARSRRRLVVKLVRQSMPNSAIVAELAQALARVSVPPAALRVSDPATAELLRAHFGSRFAIRVATTEEIEPMLVALAGELRRDDIEGSMLAGGASVDQVASWFRAAAALYRVAPWRIVTSDAQPLVIEAPGLGLRMGCVVVLGAATDDEVLLLCQSPTDYRKLVEGRVRDTHCQRSQRLGLTVFSLSFVRGSELAPVARTEIARHGFEVVAAHAYPVLRVVEPDFVTRPPTPRDVQLLTATLDALALFMDGHRRLFVEPAPLAEVATYALAQAGNEVKVTITAPHADAPWSREPTAAEAELLRHFAHEQQEADKTVRAFVAFAIETGRDESWARDAEIVARAFYEFKIRIHDGSCAGALAEAVEIFLAGGVRARRSLDEHLEAVAPDALKALCSFVCAKVSGRRQVGDG